MQVSGPAKGSSEAVLAAAQVGVIIEQAEKVANEITAEARARADQISGDAQKLADLRIAEADRASEFRVTAAEEEAAEILAGAHEQVRQALQQALASAADEADQIVSQANREARQATSDALAAAKATIGKAQTEAGLLKDDAARYEKVVRAGADAKARDLTHEARVVARDVLTEGDEVSQQLRALADSLYRNADRLLRDVKLTHARLDSAIERTVGTQPSQSISAPGAYADSDRELEVPEFMVGS